MAATLAEVTKIDPNFNKDKFLIECEREIIPTVLEVCKFVLLQILGLSHCPELLFNQHQFYFYIQIVWKCGDIIILTDMVNFVLKFKKN